jgi:hypothetical protein
MVRIRWGAVPAAGLVGAVAASAALWASGAQGAPAIKRVEASSGQVSARLSWTGDLGRLGRSSLAITRAGATFKFPNLLNEGWYAISTPEFTPLKVRDVDGDGEPEVIADLYSGGAHCCTTSIIARWDPAAGRYRLQTHDWLDAGYRLADLGRDGRVEFVTYDPRFAYSLGTSYAGGGFPVQILRYQNARLVDVSRAFPAQLESDMRGWWKIYRRAVRQGYETNGALGAFVADAVRLGRGKAAFNRVRTVYKGARGVRFVRLLKVQLKRYGYVG